MAESAQNNIRGEVILGEALKAISYGWAVLLVHGINQAGKCTCGDVDCSSPGKHPVASACPHGVKDATKDPEIVRKWFADFPESNYGIATGAISGIVVVDADIRESGDVLWIELAKEYESLSPTPHAFSGGGGRHVFFRHPGRSIKSITNLWPGIDVRGESGYGVGPGSKHVSGGIYDWQGCCSPEDCMLSDMPGWLLEKLAQREQPERDQEVSTQGWLEQSLAGLTTGNRNDTFSRVAGKLLRAGLKAPEIKALLLPHAQGCAFPETELSSLIDGICKRYGAPEEVTVFHSVPLAEYLKDESLEIRWMIEGIVPSKSAGILAGSPGLGKSWALMDLSIEVARGGKWLGQFQASTETVLYVDEENSPNLIVSRFTKLINGKEMAAAPGNFHVLAGMGISLSNEKKLKTLREELDRIKPGLVIMDSLVRVHQGEENSATEMAAVFGVVKGLIREFGCTILFADHLRKAGAFVSSQDAMLRGSSEKLAFVDVLLSMRRAQDAIILEHAKSRSGVPVPSFIVRIEDIGPEATAVRYGGDAAEHTQKAQVQAAEEIIGECLKLSSEPLSRKAIVERAKEEGISEKCVDEALKLHVGTRWIRDDRKPESGRGGKAAYYRLAGSSTPSPSLPLIEEETETESVSSVDGVAK